MGFEAYLNARDSTLRNGERQRAEQLAMQDRQTRVAAGNALATGDFSGAANALMAGGDLQGGLAVQGAQRARETADQDQQRAAIAAAASGLLYVPAAERAQVFQQRIAPVFNRVGLGQYVSQISPEDLSDASLRALVVSLGGEVEQGAFMNPGGGRIVQTDPYGGGVVEAYQVPVDPLEVELRQAQIEAARALAGQREASGEASRARANKTRSGGSGRSRGGGGARSTSASRPGGSALPPGFTVRRP